MKKKLVAIVVLAACGSISTPVFAQWYGGVSAGVSSSSDLSDPVVAGATAFSISKDDSDTGYKLQAGYQFTPNWAVEFGYVNLGKGSVTNSVTAPVVGFVRSEGKADGWNAVAVGTLPLSNGFSLLGKLGTIYSTMKANVSVGGAVVLPAGTQTSFKKSEWNWTYGLGAQYDISKTINVRAEWERFDGLRADSNFPKHDADLYSVGLNFKF